MPRKMVETEMSPGRVSYRRIRFASTLQNSAHLMMSGSGMGLPSLSRM